MLFSSLACTPRLYHVPPANAIEKNHIIAGGDGEKASLPLVANAPYYNIFLPAAQRTFDFTMAVERSMLLPLLLTKLVGGIMGAALALFLTRKSTGNAPVS